VVRRCRGRSCGPVMLLTVHVGVDGLSRAACNGQRQDRDARARAGPVVIA